MFQLYMYFQHVTKILKERHKTNFENNKLNHKINVQGNFINNLELSA